MSKEVASDEVVDVFAAPGLRKPDVSTLSDEFLEEVRGLPHRNLAVEVLQRLLNDQIKVRSKRNVVQAHIRVIVKRILRKYGYPPDKQEKATRTVLEQAEVLCTEWADLAA